MTWILHQLHFQHCALQTPQDLESHWWLVRNPSSVLPGCPAFAASIQTLCPAVASLACVGFHEVVWKTAHANCACNSFMLLRNLPSQPLWLQLRCSLESSQVVPNSLWVFSCIVWGAVCVKTNNSVDGFTRRCAFSWRRFCQAALVLRRLRRRISTETTNFNGGDEF